MNRARGNAAVAAISVVAALPLVLASCSVGRGGAGTRADRSNGLVAHRSDFHSRIVLTGELQAVHSDNITVPRLASWETTIRWMEKDGTEVVAGQKVMELDTTALIGNIDQKRLAVEKARNDLAKKEAEVDGNIAEKQFQLEQKQVELDKAQMDTTVPEELISRQKLEENELALLRARTAHEKAQENLRSSEAAGRAEIRQVQIAVEKAMRELADAETSIEAMTVLAPRGGLLVVAENRWERRKYQVGDGVFVGLTVLSIPDLAEMNVVADLSDVDDGKVAPGLPVQCTLDTYPDLHYPGIVAEVAPVAQEPSRDSLLRTFRVTVTLARSDAARMRPGMSVKVDVERQRIKGALVVPRRSIDFSAATPRVLLAGGRAVDVKLGPCNSTECVVESGIDEGSALRLMRQ